MWNTAQIEHPCQIVVSLQAATGYKRFRAERIHERFTDDVRFDATVPENDGLTYRFSVLTAQPDDLGAARKILEAFRVAIA